MKTKFLVATLISIASFGATVALAQPAKAKEFDATSQPEKLITSTAPRAEVKADTRKAVKEKSLPATGEAGPKVVIDKSSDHTRAEEKAAVRKAAKERKLAIINEAEVKVPK